MSMRLSLLAVAVLLSGCVTGTATLARDRYYYDPPRYDPPRHYRYYYPPPPVYYRRGPEYRPIIIYRDRGYRDRPHPPHRRHWRERERW